MSAETVRNEQFPEVTREDVDCVVIAPWYAGDEQRQQRAATAVVSEWSALRD
ncbi:MAG: hypothetical protein ACRD0P_17560 [Stackebrandtia sp.]